jgi:hypothetical protein
MGGDGTTALNFLPTPRSRRRRDRIEHTRCSRPLLHFFSTRIALLPRGRAQSVRRGVRSVRRFGGLSRGSARRGPEGSTELIGGPTIHGRPVARCCPLLARWIWPYTRQSGGDDRGRPRRNGWRARDARNVVASWQIQLPGHEGVATTRPSQEQTRISMSDGKKIALTWSPVSSSPQHGPCHGVAWIHPGLDPLRQR